MVQSGQSASPVNRYSRWYTLCARGSCRVPRSRWKLEHIVWSAKQPQWGDFLFISSLSCCRVSDLPAAPRDALFLDLLHGVGDLAATAPQLIEAMPGIAFVPRPNAAGQLAKPCELCDPRNKELMALMDPDVHFPADEFRSTQVQPSTLRSHPVCLSTPMWWMPLHICDISRMRQSQFGRKLRTGLMTSSRLAPAAI